MGAPGNIGGGVQEAERVWERKLKTQTYGFHLDFHLDKGALSLHLFVKERAAMNCVKSSKDPKTAGQNHELKDSNSIGGAPVFIKTVRESHLWTLLLLKYFTSIGCDMEPVHYHLISAKTLGRQLPLAQH